MPIKCIPVDQPPIDRSPTEPGRGGVWHLTVLPINVTVPAFDGQSILDACFAHHVPLDHSCGGHCACSSCRVIVRQGMEHLSAQTEDETDQLEDIDDAAPRSRLGCQAQIHGDLAVEIPEPGRNTREAGRDVEKD